jgi:hypothetical protein
MCAIVQEIMNGNHLWNDGMTKGNTICHRPFHGGGIKRIQIKILENKPHKCVYLTPGTCPDQHRSADPRRHHREYKCQTTVEFLIHVSQFLSASKSSLVLGDTISWVHVSNG